MQSENTVTANTFFFPGLALLIPRAPIKSLARFTVDLLVSFRLRGDAPSGNRGRPELSLPQLRTREIPEIRKDLLR